MDGHFLLGAGRLKVPDEFLAEVLTTSIGVKSFDGGTILGTKVSLKLLVCIEGTTFLMKKVGIAVAGFVIDKTDIVPPPMQHGNWCWSPDIAVDLPTNLLGVFTLTNFWYGLAGSLGIYA
jgi:hypothetical protein